jgi:hypothetical protein
MTWGGAEELARVDVLVFFCGLLSGLVELGAPFADADFESCPDWPFTSVKMIQFAIVIRISTIAKVQ